MCIACCVCVLHKGDGQTDDKTETHKYKTIGRWQCVLFTAAMDNVPGTYHEDVEKTMTTLTTDETMLGKNGKAGAIVAWHDDYETMEPGRRG